MKPYRSLLFVPGHKSDWVDKALQTAVDAIILDLEDSVPADAKAAARDGLADAVALVRAEAPRVGVLVRPNPATTASGPADLEASVTSGADALLVPKVADGAELRALGSVLTHIEAREGREDTIEVVASLESASGLLNAAEIVAAPRSAGALAAAAKDGDTARSVGFRWTAAGHETLAWRTHVVLACRAAAERHPVVGLWQDVTDLDGLAAFAAANRDLGFRGQVVIHPSHVDPVNTAYTPSPALVDRYEAIIEAWEEASLAGRGATMVDGEHIDLAHVRTAREIVAFARSLPT